MVAFGDIAERVTFEFGKVFPGVGKESLSWKKLKTLPHHVLVAVYQSVGDGLGYMRFLALDRFGGCLYLGGPREQTSTKGLTVLLEKEGLRIEKQSCAEIVELFDLMHPQKEVLEGVDDLPLPFAEGKENKARAYVEIIEAWS